MEVQQVRRLEGDRYIENSDGERRGGGWIPSNVPLLTSNFTSLNCKSPSLFLRRVKGVSLQG